MRSVVVGPMSTSDPDQNAATLLFSEKAILEGRHPKMTRTTHALLGAVALAAASAVLLVPGTGSAAPITTVKSPVPAASPGAVKWRFQVSGQYVLHPPAVGPDGGIVVASSTGDVYSVSAGGAQRWVVRSVGGDGGSPVVRPRRRSTCALSVSVSRPSGSG